MNPGEAKTNGVEAAHWRQVAEDILVHLEQLRDMGLKAVASSTRRPRKISVPSAESPPAVATVPASARTAPPREQLSAEVIRARQASLFDREPQNTTAPSPPASPPDPEQARAALEKLLREIGPCRRCRLHENRKSIVFGEGHPAARLVFAGEGPGHDEDVSGRPFVGRAGQLLDRMIAAMGMKREDCYICNVVKCRPPENRTPLDDEMRTCGQFLARQLEIIRPRIIVALGATAARYLLNLNQPMGKLRGRFFPYADFAELMPTFHPAYLLRNPSAKREVWQDLQQVMARLADAGGSR